MMEIDVASVSTKGQVVIPSRIRKQLGIQTGSQLMVMTDGDSVLMRAIVPPKGESFKQLIRESRELAADAGLTPADVDRAIQEARRARRS